MSTLHELERETGADLAANDYWAQARLRVIRDWIDERHPDDILDIGCGSGYLAAELANEYRTVRGIDIEAESIELAKQRDTTAVFERGDATDLAASSNTYDVVILADLIEHFDDPSSVLQEARRVCRPDGHVIVSTPAHPWLHGPHDENQGHARRYTSDLLADHGEAAGLTPVRRRWTNTVPLLPYAVMQKLVRRDVPTSVRGGVGNGRFAPVKKVMMGIEKALDPFPTGVTLIGEFTPTSDADRPSVLMTNYEYPPGCGGGGVFTHDLRESLRENGHEIPLVAGQNRSAWMKNGVLNLATWPIRNWDDLNREVSKSNPDLIHGHFTLPSSVLLPLIKRRHDIPYAVSVIGADLHDPTRYERIRPLMDLLNDRWVLKHASAITTASTDMYDRLPDRHKSKATVIPYFVDTDRYRPGGEDPFPTVHDPVRLLSVARLVPRKNLMTAIETVAHLADEGRDATLTIVGDGSQRPELHQKTIDMGLSDSVRFAGYRDGSELARIYRDHDIFFLPSHHEGFGIVFLEALASGLPVIGSDSGGHTDIITNEVGGISPATDVEAHAREITCAVSNYGTYAKRARLRAVENYSREHVTEQYSDWYNNIIADKPR